MTRWTLLALVAGYLATACGGKSEREMRHEREVACLEGGGRWFEPGEDKYSFPRVVKAGPRGDCVQ